jgi:Tfp pilus assembly PilM family ATPase
VDIGATMIRVVEVAGVDTEGFAVVSRVGLADLPEGAVSAGRVRSPRDVASALQQALRQAGVPRQGFILGLTTPDVALTRMAFPASVRSSERELSIRASGRPISTSLALDDSELATYLMGQSRPEEGDGMPMSTVGVVAALAEDVQALRDVCAVARCFPRAIDLSAAALLRSLVRVNPMAGEVGTVVDVGASKITVATRQGMFLRSVRTTVGGGQEITRALAGATGEPAEEAEERKMSMRLQAGAARPAASTFGYSPDEGVRADARQGTEITMVDLTFSNAVDVIVDAIAQSVDIDASNHGSMTQGVSLCGGTALLRGLKDRLQYRLGVPVNIGRPWADLERSRRNAANFVDGRPDPKLLLSLSTAVGLALWREPS